MTQRICIAKITTAHGIRGLVKMHIYADDVSLVNGSVFTSEEKNDTLNVTLKNATSKHWLAEIEGIADRNAAEALRGIELYINRDTLPDADDGEIYISDLIGLIASDESGKEIGEIIAVENFGAGDLLEIKPKNAESFYLPFTDDTVPHITENIVTVSIPEGLLD